MKKENIPSEIFDLLSSKDYKSLSIDEKNLVDNIMTLEEYKNLKNTVSGFQEIDEKIKIEPRSFSIPEKKVTLFSKIMNYPIPTYQVAASLMVLVGLFFLMKPALNDQNAVSVDGLTIDTTGISVANDVYPDSLIFKL